MVQQITALVVQAWQPQFNSQNPEKSGRGQLISQSCPLGAGEMALPGNPGSISSAHMVSLTCNSSPGDLTLSSGFCGHRAHVAHRHMQIKHPYTQNMCTVIMSLWFTDWLDLFLFCFILYRVSPDWQCQTSYGVPRLALNSQSYCLGRLNG